MPEAIGIKKIIEEINSTIIVSHNIPENFIVCILNHQPKTGHKSESVWLAEPVTGKLSKMAFNCNIKGKKDSKYFSFAIKNDLVNKIFIPEDAEIKNVKSDKLNTYINFNVWNDSIVKFMKDVIVYYVETFEPSDKFGCCSKYKECSKAKKCLHSNKFYSKACWYRKNLEAGKIFY
ncbi:MAG: hypothetical protein K2G63_01450 [Oscillospiraceae bacterium]|nr:hypothetical protein [Oscillospiraceae bacterium]